MGKYIEGLVSADELRKEAYKPLPIICCDFDLFSRKRKVFSSHSADLYRYMYNLKYKLEGRGIYFDSLSINGGELLPVPPTLSGIYFLFDGREIVYVGQSTDIFQRITTHDRHKPRKRFQSWTCIHGLTLDVLNLWEAAYIIQFSPHYNKTIPANPNWISMSVIKSTYGNRINIGELKKMIDRVGGDCKDGYYRIPDVRRSIRLMGMEVEF